MPAGFLWRADSARVRWRDRSRRPDGKEKPPAKAFLEVVPSPECRPTPQATSRRQTSVERARNTVRKNSVRSFSESKRLLVSWRGALQEIPETRLSTWTRPG